MDMIARLKELKYETVLIHLGYGVAYKGQLIDIGDDYIVLQCYTQQFTPHSKRMIPLSRIAFFEYDKADLDAVKLEVCYAQGIPGDNDEPQVIS